MQKDMRQLTIDFLTRYLKDHPDASLDACSKAAVAAGVHPGRSLIQTVRNQLRGAIHSPVLKDSVDRLNSQLDSRLASIRLIVERLGPDASYNQIEKSCRDLGLKADRKEVKHAIKQVRKFYRDKPASELLPLVDDHVNKILSSDSRSSELDELDAVEKALITLPTPPALKAEESRKEARKAEITLEQRRKVVAAQVREARRDESASLALAPAPEPEVKAQPESLPDAIASRFEAKMSGVAKVLPDLPPELEVGKQDNAAGRDVRTRWMEDFFLQKPAMSGNEAQLALQATFGIGLDSTIVQETLKLVREVNGMRYITRSRSSASEAAGAPQTVPPPVPGPKDPRLMITWPGCGAPEKTTADKLTESLRFIIDTAGVKPEEIEIWKPARAKIFTQIHAELDEN